MAIDDSVAIETAFTASMPHLRAPSPTPTIPSSAGIPIASSAVTVPRSLPHDTEGAADQARKHGLDWPALEDHREEPRESCRGDRGDGVLGGCSTAVGGFRNEEVVCCCHSSIVRGKHFQQRVIQDSVEELRVFSSVNAGNSAG